MLSDSELIQAFIQNSLQQKEVLLSNPALYAQKVWDSNELISKKEGRLLVVKLTDSAPQFRVKRNSSYWLCLNQLLAAHNYLLAGDVNDQDICSFEYFKLPNGYQLNVTQSVMLWRSWWRYRQRILNATLPKELWIRTRGTWYPIKNLLFSNELVYIQTLGSEICIHADDLIVWLEKVQIKPQQA